MKLLDQPSQPVHAGLRFPTGRIRVDRGNGHRQSPQTAPYLDRFAAAMETAFILAFRAAERGGRL